jgi:hypothetical protein
MKEINTSNSTFENFIAGDFLYVDKTAQIHGLVSSRQAQYFISRPRRFGKSLLLSTLKAIFQGKRELFKGLAIDDFDYDWEAYPVIHLNMGSCVGDSAPEVELNLSEMLDELAKDQGLVLSSTSVVSRLREFIHQLYQKNPVVILIDEYDKPLLSHLGQESALDIQKLLKNFYGVVKTCEDKLRFALITGVSKFSKVSIFSDLNNLTDLSMHRRAGTLLGYTQEELESNFDEYIHELAEEHSIDTDETLKRLKRWYNGYRFEKRSATVYNPVSVMKCFSELEFKNFWFETGTPSFLVQLLKKQPLDPSHELKVPPSVFSAYEPDKLQVIPLLFQTGYLTIKGCEEFGDDLIYELGYPNREVDRSFNQMLAKGLGEMDDLELHNSLRGMVKSLNEGDMDTMLKHLKVFFAGIPYDIQLSHEKYYQSLFFVIFRLMDAVVEAECRSADGRVDAILKTPERIVLLEFKLHDSAQAAMDQIQAKDYAMAYEDDGREIIKVGVAFDAETRNVGEWLVER